MITTLPFDMSEFLETDEEIALFKKESQATGDTAHITRCQAIIAKAQQRIAVGRSLSNDSEQPHEPPVKPSKR